MKAGNTFLQEVRPHYNIIEEPLKTVLKQVYHGQHNSENGGALLAGLTRDWAN